MSDTMVLIEGPLPLDVAANLMTAVGTMYPNAVADQSEPRFRRYTIAMRITEADRRALDDTPTPLPDRAALASPAEGDTEGTFLGFHDGGADVGLPETASLALGHIAHAMLTADGAVNYLESTVHTSEGIQYVVCAARSKGQTPHALRQAAEKRAEDAANALIETQAAIARIVENGDLTDADAAVLRPLSDSLTAAAEKAKGTA